MPETTDCDATGAICTDDDRKLSHPTSATVAGPPAISVRDASVQEADGAVLTFTATLSHASSSTITVGYATSDGTATAGSDYTAANGTLTFNAGDTSQTVQVTVQTDSVDEGQETLTLTLSSPVRATLANATGTGSIEDDVSSSSAVVNSPPNGLPAISGTPEVDQTLTAETSAISDADGLSNVSYAYQWLADGSVISGATGDSLILTNTQLDQTIQVQVSFDDDAGNTESLTSTATTAVAAQPAETPVVLITASFANVPADHNGENFTFQLTFSENVEAGYARIRDHAFTVDGATIANAYRQTQGSNQGWHVEVDPTGNEAVTITLPATTDCDDSGAICTDDSRKLSHPTSATVAGPPAISIDDATVQEADGAVLAFTATLSHASSRTVTVDYATSDGTATAGSDYTAANGALTFNAGDTSQTVEVSVLTDSDEEGEETLTVPCPTPARPPWPTPPVPAPSRTASPP